MGFPTNVELTSGSKLLIQRSLPNRVLPTITVTTTAAVTANSTSIPVMAISPAVGLGSLPGDVLIQQGDILIFNSTPLPTKVVVAEDVFSGNTSIKVLPVPTVIQSGNTATSNGFLLLLGVDDLSWKVNDKTISTTSMESGEWTEEQKVRLGAEISLNGFFRLGDPAIKQVLIPCATSLEIEVAFKLISPSKQFKQGFAMLKGWQEGGKLDAIKTFQGTLMVQGAFTQGVDV